MNEHNEGHAESCACLYPGDRECNCHKAYGFDTAEDMEAADAADRAAREKPRMRDNEHTGFPRHTGATIRARMGNNLVPLFLTYFTAEEVDAECAAFLNSIEGSEVILRFTHGDAFEVTDNNYWLPDFSWAPIIEGEAPNE